MNKKAYFFIDDTIWAFRDIARQKPASIFDQPFLALMKEAHDKYGMKVQLNLFYQTDFFYGHDEFSLAEMPDTYKAEWEANSDWLKLAFHARHEFPDYPYVNATYEDVKYDFDRILYTSTHYPANYGFIPRTYGDDNDPLDVLLVCSEKIQPMTLVRAYPIGVISMIDNGRNDEKIIAIPFNDPTYNMFTDIEQLPNHVFEEMGHFFTVYKNLENKTTAVNEVSGRETAISIINSAIDNYIEKFCK